MPDRDCARRTTAKKTIQGFDASSKLNASELDLALFPDLPIGRALGFYLDQDDARRVGTLLKTLVEITISMLLEGRLVADKFCRAPDGHLDAV